MDYTQKVIQEQHDKTIRYANQAIVWAAISVVAALSSIVIELIGVCK